MAKYDPVKTPRKIKELRERHGLTQEEIADKLKVSRDTISQWKKAYPEVAAALETKPLTEKEKKYDENYHPLHAVYLRSIGVMMDAKMSEGLGISESTYYEWKKKYKEFAAACDKTREVMMGHVLVTAVKAATESRYVTEEKIIYEYVPNPEHRLNKDAPKSIEVASRREVINKEVLPQAGDFEKTLRMLGRDEAENKAAGAAQPAKKEEPKSEEEREIEERLSKVPRQYLYAIERVRRERRELFEQYFKDGNIQPLLDYLHSRPTASIQ